MCVTKTLSVIIWKKGCHHALQVKEPAKALKAQPKLPFQGAQSNEELNRTEVELKMAVLTASSNVPVAFHDCLSPTIRKVFPDS